MVFLHHPSIVAAIIDVVTFVIGFLIGFYLFRRD
jgi:uncharacterized protein YneF (UPF0154 family)